MPRAKDDRTFAATSGKRWRRTTSVGKAPRKGVPRLGTSKPLPSIDGRPGKRPRPSQTLSMTDTIMSAMRVRLGSGNSSREGSVSPLPLQHTRARARARARAPARSGHGQRLLPHAWRRLARAHTPHGCMGAQVSPTWNHTCTGSRSPLGLHAHACTCSNGVDHGFPQQLKRGRLLRMQDWCALAWLPARRLPVCRVPAPTPRLCRQHKCTLATRTRCVATSACMCGLPVFY